MEENKPVGILFSGGTDSTLTAALLTKEYKKIHLITFDRLGIFEVKNSEKNYKRLQNKFPETEFVYKIIDFNDVFKKISYQNYIRNLTKYGFMNLSTCGLCKLSMHIAMIAYCLENQIEQVSDGANRGMEIFPAQMDIIIEKLRDFYKTYGISYTNPVFDFAPPEEKSLIKDKEMAQIMSGGVSKREANYESSGETTEQKLYSLGLSPQQEVKGTHYDKKRQPRCFQFMIFNVYVQKWFLPKHNMDEYRKNTLDFFSHKITESKFLLDDYQKGIGKGIFNKEKT